LAQTRLRLRHGTRVDQLQRILEGVRALLQQDPLIEKPAARIRLIEFGPQAIELELYAYVLTSDFAEFLALREALLLKIAALVEAAGSSFAPVQRFAFEGEGPARAEAPGVPAPIRTEVRLAERAAQANPQGRR